MTNEEKEDALSSYVETALWSSPCEEEDIEFLDAKYRIEDFDEKTLSDMKEEMVSFIDKYYHLVSEDDKDTSISMFAHNLWLTRNGHGAGFWDGDYNNGDELTDACEGLKNIDLYVGDDGRIYS